VYFGSDNVGNMITSIVVKLVPEQAFFGIALYKERDIRLVGRIDGDLSIDFNAYSVNFVRVSNERNKANNLPVII
jgi:hypothetical protein